MGRLVVGTVAVAALLCANAVGHAAVVSFSLVTIGSPGNPADDTGYGAVGYVYAIGQYEVTNAQYAAFLNAVDPNGIKPLKLYHNNMGSNAQAGGIVYDGNAAPGHHYSPKSGREDWPVNYVSIWNAARFVNWLQNGQPVLGTSAGIADIESVCDHGAYDIVEGTALVRHADAAWFLPNFDEWYKAAFYNPAAGAYYDYATRSNTPPVASVPPGDAVSANLNNIAGGPTPVGAYTEAYGPFGTFDQAGNIGEWMEDFVTVNNDLAAALSDHYGKKRAYKAGYMKWINPGATWATTGFRVAAVAPVPEPNSIAGLCGIGAVVGIGYMYRRHTMRQRRASHRVKRTD
ncbi:hypothetical protein JCM19992_34660 [Thermostilla marina]